MYFCKSACPSTIPSDFANIFTVTMRHLHLQPLFIRLPRLSESPQLRLLPLRFHQHQLRSSLRCRHRRPTPTLRAQLLARPLTPRTSLPLLMLSLATLLPLTIVTRRSARCNMCTRTKRVPYLWSFVHHIYRRGEDFQRSMCKRRASGRHEE